MKIESKLTTSYTYCITVDFQMKIAQSSSFRQIPWVWGKLSKSQWQWLATGMEHWTNESVFTRATKMIHSECYVHGYMNGFTQFEFYGVKFVISSVNALMRSSTTVACCTIHFDANQSSPNDIQTYSVVVQCRVQRNMDTHEPRAIGTTKEMTNWTNEWLMRSKNEEFIHTFVPHPFFYNGRFFMGNEPMNKCEMFTYFEA